MLRQRIFRSTLNWLLFAAACGITQQFCKNKTDSFAVCKIQSDLPYHPEWETSSLSPEEMSQVKQVLKQPFTYLGKGAQCYVFVSQDNQYVLKFFRLSHLLPPFWTHLPLPSFLRPYAQAKIVQKQGELERDFLSYQIAFEEMREQTGLLYVHLNKTDWIDQQVTFFDKLQIRHELPLDQMEFLVQKRADLLYPALETMAQSEGIDRARAALSDLVDLLVLRCQKGIRDKDPDLNTNFGFIGHTPVQIDVGRYRKSTDGTDLPFERDEIIRITDHLNQWLRARYPELSDHLEAKILSL